MYNLTFTVSWQILLNLKVKGSTSLACNIYWELNVKLFVSLILKCNFAVFSCMFFMINLHQPIFRKKYQTFGSLIFSQLLSLPSLNLTLAHKPSLAEVLVSRETPPNNNGRKMTSQGCLKHMPIVACECSFCSQKSKLKSIDYGYSVFSKH